MTGCHFLDTNTCIYPLKGTFAAIASHHASLRPSQIKIPVIHDN